MAQYQNMREQVLTNTNFRQVIETGQYMQVEIMSIPHGGDIGEDVHADSDQFLYLIDGAGTAVLNGVASDFNSGDLIFVPAGTSHNFITKDGHDMKMLVAYSPPHHPDGMVESVKS